MLSLSIYMLASLVVGILLHATFEGVKDKSDWYMIVGLAVFWPFVLVLVLINKFWGYNGGKE